MTESQTKLIIDALTKASLGTICAVALAGACGFQLWTMHQWQQAHTEHLSEVREMIRESVDNEKRLAETLTEIVRQRP